MHLHNKVTGTAISVIRASLGLPRGSCPIITTDLRLKAANRSVCKEISRASEVEK